MQRAQQMNGRVTSVGSLNLDVTYAVERLPRPGETLLSTESERLCGGKGANQAAAAAAAGAAVAMVGAVGDDDPGRVMLEDLMARGVDVDGVRREPARRSGTAVIFRGEQDGENMIVVDAGANASLTAADVQVDAVRDAAVVLAQLEVRIDAVTAAAGVASGLFVLNIAPWQPLPDKLLQCVDVLVANQAEIALQLNVEAPATLDETVALLEQTGRPARTEASLPCSTIVTVGGSGAVVFDRRTSATIAIPAPSVSVIDTTGAGDCFCGVLAARLADGAPLIDAATDAVAGASLSTQAVGARGQLPTLAQIRQAI